MIRFAVALAIFVALPGVAWSQESSLPPASDLSSSSAQSTSSSDVSAASSQEVANVNPDMSIADIPGVVKQCQIVADAEKAGDNSPRGKCIGATQSFLDALKAVNPALSDDDFDQRIADLVVALVPLAQQDEACNAVDDEVARAIKLASTYSRTKEQTDQLVSISETVAACTADQTAAIPSAIPASPA
jgi:hypothetical protein